MRVAVLTQYFPTSVQPWMGHSAYQTLRKLAQKCDLHVFYPDANYPSFLTPKTRVAKPIDPNWNPPDVQATYIPYPVLPVVSRPLNGFAIAHRVLPHIRSFQPDILLNYVVYPDGYATVRVGNALKIPTVLTAIGSDLNRISDPLCEVLTKSALRQASFVTTVSHDLCKTAIRLGANPAASKAILNGCDTALFRPQDRAQAREALAIDSAAEVIVYVGRLDIRKGLVELIDAIAQLRAKHPKLHTYLIGEGPDRPVVLEAIARNQCADLITLVPSCPTDQVARWMAASDLVTLPSYKEGCPNVVIEALCAGRPVVATNVGGIPELMDSASGRLVPAKDVTALTQGLDEVLSQTWNAIAIADKHKRSWSDVADDLYAVLQKTLLVDKFFVNSHKSPSS
jgi:glycosyltransferase involved in cell wall biosynthesis